MGEDRGQQKNIINSMNSLPILPLITLVPAGILAYIVVGAIYRLYFHPLSKFPGPKLAAITHLYEFYFNLVKGGMFIWEIERMHEKYGTVPVEFVDSLPQVHPS